MPILTDSGLRGRVVYLGRVADRAERLESDPADLLRLGFDGVEGEHHSGLTRASCARVTAQYDKGTEIRNTRQLSLVSAEELGATAAEMGLDRIDPGWVGASVVVEGIPDFTLVPPSSRLIFDGGASLAIDMENAPCIFPGKVIERHHPGKGPLYKPAARRRRGVTAWVERPGRIVLGDTVALHCPPNRLYPHLPQQIGRNPAEARRNRSGEPVADAV